METLHVAGGILIAAAVIGIMKLGDIAFQTGLKGLSYTLIIVGVLVGAYIVLISFA